MVTRTVCEGDPYGRCPETKDVSEEILGQDWRTRTNNNGNSTKRMVDVEVLLIGDRMG